MLRLLAILGGLAGGAGLSQFPEFSQQYLQRLGGQAEALALVVAEFDASAARAGLSREAALAELSGTTFLELRQDDMRRTLVRAGRVAGDYALLRAASPLERMALPHRFRDSETLGAVWADYRPAVPVTMDGLTAAGGGFVLGWGMVAGLLALLARAFRRKPAAGRGPEPALRRPGR